MQSRDIKIGSKTFKITSDDLYLQHMSEDFETFTLQLFDRFINPRSQVLDVGANIGLTTLYFGTKTERVLGIEAVPTTFKILESNVKASGLTNITVINRAASNKPGSLPMTYGLNDRSGGFVSDQLRPEEGHGTESTQSETLDEIYKAGLTRVDFIKLDIEGYEKFCLGGCHAYPF